MENLIKNMLSKCSDTYVEIRVEEDTGTRIGYQGKELETINPYSEKGGAVRVYNAGGWGFCSFNDLNSIGKCIEEARGYARKTAKSLPPLSKNKPESGRCFTTVQEDPRNISLEEKIQIAKRYNDMIQRNKRIVTSRVVYGDRCQNIWFGNSMGTYLEQEKIYTGITFMATAKEGANVQQAYRSEGELCGFEIVRDKELKVEETMKDAIDLLSAPKIDGGRYTVVLDQKLTGVFAHEAFGHMSESDFIFDNPKFADKMKLGTRYGPASLNIVDSGLEKGARGSYEYDDEGVPAQKTYLIKEGTLSGHLHSRESAERMGEPLTGNARAIGYRHAPIVRMSCTYIEPGNNPFGNMISEVDNGIYACGMLGGNTDLEMFTFSAEKAYHIKNGRIGELLRDVVLTGNVFETLGNIDSIGDDFKLYGGMGGCGKGGQSPLPVSDGGPHIRIKNLLIG